MSRQSQIDRTSQPAAVFPICSKGSAVSRKNARMIDSASGGLLSSLPQHHPVQELTRKLQM